MPNGKVSGGNFAPLFPFMQLSSKKWLAIAVTFFLLLFVIVFLPALAGADEKVMSLGGDGCKNVFTYLYHVLYGKGLWFEGMNYPFGEHVVFTDNQPAVSVTLAALNKWLHLSPGSVLAVMYYLIAGSYLIGAIYTYRTLVHFRAHPAFAIPVAALIMMLSPQIYGIQGHFPLSYAAFVPVLFYWSVRYHETSGWQYALKIFLLLFLHAFLHMYFLAMGALWMAAYVVAYLLMIRQPLSRKLRHAGVYFGVMIAAYIGVQLIFRLTDPVPDRPVYPLKTVPGPALREISNNSRSPVWQFLQENDLAAELKEPGEGGAYFGLATFAMLLAGAGFLLYGRVRRNHGAPPPTMPWIWLVVAAGITVFALKVVAVWDWPLLSALLKPMRQFRTPARFTWIGYYVFGMYAGLLLWRILSTWRQNRRTAIPAILIVAVTGVLWITEAWANVSWMPGKEQEWKWNSEFFFSTKEDGWKKFLADRGHRPQDFSAIVTLPFVHVGSEKLGVRGSDVWSMTLAYTAAIQLHLPIMDVNMSRTGWQQTFDQVRLDGGPIAQVPVLKSLHDERPMLLLHFKDYPIFPDEEAIYAVSDSIGYLKDCGVYVFSQKAYLARRREVRDSLSLTAAAQPTADATYHSSLPVFVNHYEAKVVKHHFAGGGGLAAIRPGDSIVADWKLPSPADGERYEFSAWAKLPALGYTVNRYALTCYDATGVELGRADALGTQSVDNAPGLWFRINAWFTIPSGTVRIVVRVFQGDAIDYEAMDELLIRPVDATVISKFPDGTVLVNNHVLDAGRPPKP